MSGINSMIVNGTDVTTKNFYLIKVPSIVKPQRRVRLINIPGRSGFLTEWNGDYEAYTKEPELLYTGSTPDTDANFLRGATLVTFGNEPTLVYECRADESFEMKLGKSGEYIVKLPLLCQPLKKLITGTTSSGDVTYSITNAGNEIAYPKIVVTGIGSKTVTIGAQIITLAFAVAGETLTIDSLNGQVYDSSGNNAWSKLTGDLPFIPVSASAITVSTTGSELTVTHNWRFS